MTGTIYKSTGSWYSVRTEDGRQWNARIKGIFKLDEITSTNPLAVGDVVELEMEAEAGDEGTAMITAIHDRRNYINRQSPSHKIQHHIIAANVDQSLLIATMKEPRTSQGFIDRHLVACEAYHVPAIVVFNKADLYRKKEDDRFAAWKEMYSSIGYRIIRMSVQTGEGVAELEELLQGKTSLLSGHSGVGKSSLLNVILPELKLKTQGVSGWSGKGIHTTTFAEMYDLPGAQSKQAASGEARSGGAGAGRIIDTPGMREFGLVDISKAELSGYFPEMRALVGQCQFNNCVHMEEPGCAVKQAVREGRIHEDRYISYCGILDSIGVWTKY